MNVLNGRPEQAGVKGSWVDYCWRDDNVKNPPSIQYNNHYLPSRRSPTAKSTFS